MKIAVLVPSEEYKSYAGARIRYGRLGSELGLLGVDLRLEDIATFDPESSPCDVLLISKCHDARSLVHAAHAAKTGHLVGIDIFDDYFSQSRDSRLVRYRNWMKQMLPICDFALCSTNAMSETVARLRSDLRRHVVNDPATDVAQEALADTLDRKLRQVREEKRLPLAWFGVGDNPHFKVGLNDVSAYANVLKEMAGRGWDVQLSLLTNVRALDADRLSMIASLPVRTTLEEWTEEREQALLLDSFACFLPVNAQAFSAAKSLNRAITALTHGCQAISAGYPLYSILDSLIYRDPNLFLSDVAKGSMRLSSTGMKEYQELLDRYASPKGEAERLSSFLKSLSYPRRELRPLALIHGHATNGGAHERVQELGGFSVGSPFCTAKLGFDVMFYGSPKALTMLISDRAAKRLGPGSRRQLTNSRLIGKQTYWELPEAEAPDVALPGDVAVGQELPLPYQLATYAETMKHIRRRMRSEFDCGATIVSETSIYPFHFTV